jgi:homocysteine S-methyltransferase
MTFAKYRDALPHLKDGLYLADGGLESTLVFHEGYDLPHFAAFTLLATTEGRSVLDRYFIRHIELARAAATGYVLDTPTWRASPGWGARMGLDAAAIDRINRDSVVCAMALRDANETVQTPIVISGVVGPQGDGYAPDRYLSPDAARDYHRPQIESLGAAGADMISAYTITHTGEAVGIIRAAQAAALPVAVSFTVETDGRLPSGQPLGEAIAEADAMTGSAAIYYMINCAHPTHFRESLDRDAAWLSRIGAIRANASRLSHAELDQATELDSGDPHDLADHYRELVAILPGLRVVGGCCGTDHRHIEAISHGCFHHAA